MKKRSRYLFLLPALIPVVLVEWSSTFLTTYYSFTHYDYVKPPQWVGYANYERLLSDVQIPVSMVNTIGYVAGSWLVGVALALLIALMLHYVVKNRWVNRLGRMVFYIPLVLSPTAVGIIWKLALSSNRGAVNEILNMIGLDQYAQGWLTAPFPYNTLVRIWCYVWWVIGLNVIIYLAGVENMPEDPIDAARVDGASTFQVFRHVVVPLLRPVTAIVTANTLVMAVRVFDIPWVLRLGTARATETLSVTMYRDTFWIMDMGWGAAIAVITTLLALVLCVWWLRPSTHLQ